MGMARLIDVDALIAEYDRVHIGEPGKARKLMEDAPTIDAVPVVRCKDCRHSILPELMTAECTYWHEVVGINGFCHHGEGRK